MKDLILITGVSGYIGFRTLVFALEAGHYVRAVVRKSVQISNLRSHIRIQPYLDNLNFVVIPDLTDIDALVEKLEGVSGILHLASPLAIETDEYDKDIVQPALSVTNSILTAASGIPTIKRIVTTSSAVTLIPFSWLSTPNISKLYTSQDLNTSTNPPYSSSMEAYWSSKALSRIAVHDFIATKPHFEIIQLLPSVVIGLTS